MSMTLNELIKYLEVRRDLTNQGDLEVRIHMGCLERTVEISHVGEDHVKKDGFIDLSESYCKTPRITLIVPMPEVLRNS